jgi:hypothetical protein
MTAQVTTIPAPPAQPKKIVIRKIEKIEATMCGIRGNMCG